MATETRSLQITSKMTDQASAGFAKLLAVGRGAAGGLVSAFKGVGIAIGAIAAGSATAFVAFRKVAEDLDNVAKAVDRLGVSAESLTSLRNGAELAGVSFEDLTNAVKFFEKFIDEANQGGKKQRELLAELGLRAEQLAGNNLDLVDVLGKVGDGLDLVGGSAARTNAMLQLFGRTGTNLGPLLQQGSDGIAKLAQEARTLGVVFSREELARVEAFNDSWEQLKQTFSALAQRLVIEVAPAFTSLFETMQKVFTENSTEIRSAFLDLLSALVEGFKVLSRIFDTVRLSIAGWKLLALSVQEVAQQTTGNTQKSETLTKAIQDQITYVSQLRDGFGATTDTMVGLEESIRRLREQSGKGPIIPPTQAAAPGQGADKPADLVEPSAFDKFNEGVKKASLQWRDFAQTAYQSGQVLVGGTLDALTDNISAAITRTKSWGQAWKDLGRSVLGILANVITKLITVKILSAIFGSTSGGADVKTQATGGVEPGVIKSTVPLQRFAMGGIARGPTLALMGEGRAPAEAFVPLPDGRSIPVSFRGGEGGQTVVINQTFQSVDARGTYELFRQNRGTIRQFVGDDMTRRNRFRGTVKGAAR